MITITFDITRETGQMTTHIQGAPGGACVDVQRMIERIRGAADEEHDTAEMDEQAVYQTAEAS